MKLIVICMILAVTQQSFSKPVPDNKNQNKRLYTVVTGNEDDNGFYRPINDAGQNIDGNGIEVVGIETLPGKRNPSKRFDFTDWVKEVGSDIKSGVSTAGDKLEDAFNDFKDLFDKRNYSKRFDFGDWLKDRGSDIKSGAKAVKKTFQELLGIALLTIISFGDD